MTTVWLSPSATSFACLCEPCLEAARTSGALFADALANASVRGSIAAEVGAHRGTLQRRAIASCSGASSGRRR